MDELLLGARNLLLIQNGLAKEHLFQKLSLDLITRHYKEFL
jgi:hypothetical protein